MQVPYTIVLPTIYGQMLVNRHDINQTGALLRSCAALDFHEINFAVMVCKNATKGAVALDIGANFGVYSLAIAQALAPHEGVVHAFEPQRMLAYNICGSAALNSIENLIVHHSCVGSSTNDVDIPHYDYHQTLNFGSVEFGGQQKEQLHQERKKPVEKVKQVRIDDGNYTNVRFMKVDVEGMEWDVLQGAKQTIARELPIALVEYIKSDKEQLIDFFVVLGYKIWDWNGNLLCIHSKESDNFKLEQAPIAGA